MNTFTCLLMFFLTGACLLLRRERKRHALRIRTLEEVTAVQVREARMQSARETRERLGQDLHDELSAALAAVVHQIWFISRETPDLQMKKHLDSLRVRTGHIYRSVREKSHLLYSGGADSSLDHSIKAIADLILPGDIYRKEIEIDPQAAGALDAGQRTEILGMRQEAAANIRKHAQNATEVFIFLYKDETGNIIFQVGDNGREFKPVSAGIGLTSMRKRADHLKGKFRMESGEWTAITVTLPGRSDCEYVIR